MDADLAEKLRRRMQCIETVGGDSASETSSSLSMASDPPDSPISSSAASTASSSVGHQDLSTTTGGGDGTKMQRRPSFFNPFSEYSEFSRKQIQSLQQTFDKFDADRDKALNFIELKYMMEKLGIPQTHLGLKQMIKEVDEDQDDKISFREFLLIFRKAISDNNGSASLTPVSNVLQQLYSMLMEIDVAKEGVGGAKFFFEAKVAAISEGDKYQREIREEQDQRRRAEEEKARRKLAFQNRVAQFQST